MNRRQLAEVPHPLMLAVATKIGVQLAPDFVQAVEDAMRDRIDEAACQGFWKGVEACVGPEYKEAARDILTGFAATDAEVADRLGLSRQAVSKMARRLRHNIGLARLRCPNMARHLSTSNSNRARPRPE